MYNITNVMNGQIVCTLKDGNTLRLDVGATVTISEDEMTDYLKTLETRGLIVITKIEADEPIKEDTASKKTTRKSK